MNSVMRSYTPDIGTRLSTMESPSLSAASLPLRRRYSITFGASVSLAINGNKMSAVVSNGTQTPPGPVAASNLAKSKSETPVSRTVQKAMSVHENLMMKILSTPVDQPLSLDCSTLAEEVSLCSSLGSPATPLSSEQLMESDEVLRCFTPPNGLDCHKDPRMARLYKDLRSPSATTRIRALRALKSPSKRDAYGQFDVPHEQQDIITAEERNNLEHKTIQEVMAGVCIYVEVRSGADNRSDGIKDHVASLGAKVNERLYKDTTHVIFKDGLLSTYQKAKKMNIPVVSILWIEACKRHMCLMNPEGYPISNLERYENPELFKKIRRQKSMQPRAEETTNSAGKKKHPAPVPDANAKLSLSAKLPVLHRLRNDDGLEKILNDFQAENASNTEPQDDFDRLLSGPMRLLEKFRNSPVAGMSANQKPADKPTSEGQKNVSTTAVTPEMPLKRTRKSLLNGHAVDQKSPTDSSTSRRRRSSVTKEVTPTQPTSARQRRKTILFTPRVTSVQEEQETPISGTNKKRNSSSKKRHTICSPKAMDLCKSKDTTKEAENMPPPSSQKNRNTLYTPKMMEQEKTDKTVRVDTGDEDAARKTLGCAIVDTTYSSNETAQQTKTPEMDAKDLDAFKTNRRRTLYTPGVYDEPERQNQTFHTPVVNHKRSTMFQPPANSTIAEKTPVTNGSLRRRTLYTPSPAVSIPETPPVVNRRRTMFASNAEQTVAEIHEPPKPSTPASVDNRKQQQHRTLIEEYQSTLTFSSSKTPISERRRTIFDISMDIIDKRLSQINQLSKQSDPTSGSSIATPTPLMLKSPPARPLLSVSRQTSLDTFYRKLSKSTEKSAQSKTINIRKSMALTAAADDNTGPVVPRKRKLFNAQPTDGSPNGSPPDTPAVAALLSDSTSNPSKKAKTTTPPKLTVPAAVKTPAPNRRRSLAITQQHAKSASAAIGGATSLAGTTRRSSMFFQSGRRANPVIAPRPVMGTQARAMKKALGPLLLPGLPSVASQQENRAVTGSRPAQQKYHLATTNLHAEQHTFVKEASSTSGPLRNGALPLVAKHPSENTTTKELEGRNCLTSAGNPSSSLSVASTTDIQRPKPSINTPKKDSSRRLSIRKKVDKIDQEYLYF